MYIAFRAHSSGLLNHHLVAGHPFCSRIKSEMTVTDRGFKYGFI